MPTFVNRGVSRGYSGGPPSPRSLITVFWTGAVTFLSNGPSLILTRLSETHFRPTVTQNLVALGIEPEISGAEATNCALDHRGIMHKYISSNYYAILEK
jgi:hypothetical protein